MTCLFCDIVANKIPADVVYEDADVLAFRDISPQAPEHVLVIPKAHYDSVLSLSEAAPDAVVAIHRAILNVQAMLHLDSGFRVVTNVGKDGGQTVNHVHYHILGGRQLSWPPG